MHTKRLIAVHWLWYPCVRMNCSHGFKSPKGLSLIFFLTSSLISSKLIHGKEKLHVTQRSRTCCLCQTGSKGVPESCLICTGISAKWSSLSSILKVMPLWLWRRARATVVAIRYQDQKNSVKTKVSQTHFLLRKWIPWSPGTHCSSNLAMISITAENTTQLLDSRLSM